MDIRRVSVLREQEKGIDILVRTMHNDIVHYGTYGGIDSSRDIKIIDSIELPNIFDLTKYKDVLKYLKKANLDQHEKIKRYVPCKDLEEGKVRVYTLK
ncbi:MAG: hypothetical protein V3V78_01250 [Candidatus Woesearchaeota archaeon]